MPLHFSDGDTFARQIRFSAATADRPYLIALDGRSGVIQMCFGFRGGFGPMMRPKFHTLRGCWFCAWISMGDPLLWTLHPGKFYQMRTGLSRLW